MVDPDLHLAWPTNAVEWVVLVAWFFIGVKLLATVMQAVLLRGDYRAKPDTPLYRASYVLGKVTPALATATFATAYATDREWATAAEFGVFTVAVAGLAWFAVRLRQQGRFYGVADLLSRRDH